MTTEQFVYWLKGKLELRNPDDLSIEEWNKITEKMASVLCIQDQATKYATTAPVTPTSSHSVSPNLLQCKPKPVPIII